MSINELFTTANETTTNGRSLTGTAELTNRAAAAAKSIIKAMESDIDNYREKIAKSSSDNHVLDELINEFKPFEPIDEESILRNLDEATVDSMLKSQQSKRSRARSKAMTLDNYYSLMTAAIAEDILRELYNKPKSAVGNRRMGGSIDYTPAQLEAYAEDQEALRKEIRNVQSKKSIMKSKADFDETSEAWQQLLKAEQMLKDLRVGGRTTTVIEVDKTKDALSELLAEVDPEHLKASDSKELLAKIASMLK